MLPSLCGVPRPLENALSELRLPGVEHRLGDAMPEVKLRRPHLRFRDPYNEIPRDLGRYCSFTL